MRARLHVRPEQLPPFEVAIGDTASIGRAADAVVCLHPDPLVSRQHALIRAQSDGRYYVTDLGSRNGTYVDDRPVLLPVLLSSGSVIRIAGTEITFYVEEAAAAAPSEHTQFDLAHHVAPAAAPSLALLVCDIRNFTRNSEGLSAGELTPLLTEWFREIGGLVERAGGVVDKFIGDAMLAFWGMGLDGMPCDIALSVARRLQRLAAARSWPRGALFEIVVALHFGPATISNVGLRGERDATVIGDAVNATFRIEEFAKSASEPIVLSEDFRASLAAEPQLIDLGEQSLKGRSLPLRLFGLAP